MLFNPVAHLPTFNPLALLRMAGAMTSHAFSLSETPDLAGRVVVVTGGSAGIGREFCAQLLLHGVAKIYVLARSESRFAEARAEWSQKHALADSDLAARVDFIRCDLTDVEAVQRAARSLSERLDRLDILILNGTCCFHFFCLHAVSTPRLMPLSRPSSVTRLPALAPGRRASIRCQPPRPFCPDQSAASAR